jgi:hypothetical protein
MISDNPNNDALQFIKVITSLAQKLSPSELMYWGRNNGQLYMRLKLGTVVSLQELPAEKVTIPALEQAIAKQVLRGGPFVKGHLGFEVGEHFKYTYKATLQTEVMPYVCATSLSREEILRDIDDDGTQVALTPQQIRNLATRQSERGRSGPLSLDTPTYCFVETKRYRAELVQLFWDKSEDYPLSKNRWELLFSTNVVGGRILFAI